MTETPQPCRRPAFFFETPSPHSLSTDRVDTSLDSMQSSDLVGVLEQVSELTMDDSAFAVDPNALRTPVSLNPRPAAPSSLSMSDEDLSKRKQPPCLEVRKKLRRGNSCVTSPTKLLSAPPLPSSPDLSAGGDVRMIPPQFSPLGSSHTIDLGSILLRQMRGSQDVEAVLSPREMPPAPPPTPQVSSLPPPMPWFETPEQGPRKKVLAASLPMKKGPFLDSVL